MSYRLFIYVLLGGIILNSCIKNDESFEPYQDLGIVENLLKRINNGTESFIIDQTKDNQIITSNETIISIPARSFMNKSNEIVSSEIKLLFTNIVTSGQALLSGNSTMVNGDPFYASTMTVISATDLEGEVLKLKEDASISIFYPCEAEELDEEIKLFRGIETDAQFSWIEMSEPIIQNQLEIGSWEVIWENGAVFGSGYKYKLTKMGWYGIGKYTSGGSSESMKICAQLPELFNSNNTKVFFVFEDLISIVNLQSLNETNGDFCGQINLPNEKGLFSIISISSTEIEEYYLGILSNPNTNESNFIIDPKKKTLQEITEFLYQK